MADDIIAKREINTLPIDTFSFCDRHEPQDDDSVYFTKVEERRGRVGIHIDLKESSVPFSLSYMRFVGTPGFGDREEMKAALCDIMHSRGCRVVLSGLGGDELTGQGSNPRVQMAELFLKFRFVKLAKQLMAWSLLFRRPLIQVLFETIGVVLPMSMRAQMTRVAKVDPWINRKFAQRHRLPIRQLEAVKGAWFWLPTVRDSYQTYAGLAQQMTYSPPSVLEKRYPYLDQTLTEFLMSIPSDQLLRPGQRRFVMRKSLAGLLPPEIVARNTKAAGGRCHSITLQRNWQELANIVRSPLIARLGFVDQAEFHAALVNAKHGNFSPFFLRLFRAISLELWLQDIVNRGVIAIAPGMPLKLGATLVQSRT
jgi:asparagine synthase (glutamine-hydrolysing)